MGRDEDFSLGSGKVLFATAKALKVLTEHVGMVWIPRAAVHPDGDLVAIAEKGDEADEVLVHAWFAERRGWL